MATTVRKPPTEEAELAESVGADVEINAREAAPDVEEGEFEDLTDDEIQDRALEETDFIPPQPPSQETSPQFSPVSKAQTKIKAKDIQEKIVFPDVPGEVITFSIFQEWVELLTKAHRDNLEIYQYRKYPLTDHRLIDPAMPAYVEFYSGIDGGDLPTMDGILSIHGGGVYRFDVCDATKPRNRKMFEVKLDIDWREHPPKIPDLRVVRTDIRKNAPYIQWLVTEGLATLDEENRIVPTVNIVQRGSQGGNVSGVNADRLVERLLNKLDDVTTKGGGDEVQTAVLLEAIKSQSAGNIEQIKATWDLVKSGGNQFDIMDALEKLDKLRAPQGEGDSKLMTMFVGMMMESQKTTNAMMLEMVKAQNKAPASAQTTGIKEVIELIPLLQGLGGGGKVGKTEWWETLAEHGAPVVQTALQTFQTAMSLRAGQQPQPGQGGIRQPQPNPTQQHQQTNVPATGGYGAQALAEQRAAQEGTQEGMQMPEQNQQQQQQQPMAQEPTQDELLQMLDAYGEIILDGMLNQDGHYFANSLLQMFGQRAVPIYNLIRHRGKEAVVGVIKSHPNFWSRIEAATAGDAEPQVLAWVDDFINYEARLKAEEEGEDPPVEVVPPGSASGPPAPPTQG